MQKRLNITLPNETVALLDRAAPRGDRSRLIDAAVRQYIGRSGRAQLRRRMIEGYQSRAEADLRETAAWFALEEEAWEKQSR